MKQFVALTVILMICLSVADADAQWPRGKQKGYVQASYGRGTADQGYDPDGNVEPLGGVDDPQELDDKGLYMYAEYGLSETMTLVMSSYAKRLGVQTATDQTHTKGVADLTLVLRYAAFKGEKWVVSTETGMRVPSGYDPAATPPLGSGEIDFLFGATAGLSLHPTPGYLGSSFGFRARGGIISNEYYGHIEAGMFPHPKLLVRGRMDFVESTAHETSAFDVMTQVTEQGYLTVGPGLSILATGKWQVHLDARWTTRGRTTSKIGSVAGGVAFLW